MFIFIDDNIVIFSRQNLEPSLCSWGLIGLPVFTFIGHKQTGTQTDKANHVITPIAGMH